MVAAPVLVPVSEPAAEEAPPQESEAPLAAEDPAPIEDTKDVTPEPVADPAPEAEPIAVDGDLPAMPDAPPIAIDGPGLGTSMPQVPAPFSRVSRRNRGNR